MSIKLRIKELKNKGKSLYLDIYFNGKRKYEFLGININKEDSPDMRKEKLALANHIRSQREIEFNSDSSTYVPNHLKKVNVVDFYNSYLNNYTKKDKRMIRYSFEKFIKFLEINNMIQNNIFQAKELTKEVCSDFKDFLISPESGLSGETPSNYFRRFKKVLRAAASKGLFRESPAEKIVFKNSDEIVKLNKQILTIDEMRILSKTQCGNEEVKKAFLFACHTGLGMAEIRVLKWINIDNQRLISIRAKTKVKINIQLSKSALDLIGERKKADEEVFNLLISDQAISKNLKNWIKKAGIEKKISFYCGRHSYAVLLLQTNNLKTVSDAMAQTSTRHTTKYLNFVDNLKDDATSNLPSF